MDTDSVLRYSINEKDQIRSIAHPDQEFNFFISKNERICEVQREAMNSTSLKTVRERGKRTLIHFSMYPQRAQSSLRSGGPPDHSPSS